MIVNVYVMSNLKTDAEFEKMKHQINKLQRTNSKQTTQRDQIGQTNMKKGVHCICDKCTKHFAPSFWVYLNTWFQLSAMCHFLRF